MWRKKTNKAIKLDLIGHQDEMIREKPSEEAKKHFNRKPYSTRGDTSGQDHSK